MFPLTPQDETVISGSEFHARLREQFRKMNPASAAWARLPDPADAGGGALDLFQSSASLLQRSKRLQPGRLNVTRVKNANIHAPSEAVVQALAFHPRKPLLLTAGFDKKLRLFSADGIRNELVQTVVIPDLPIHAAAYCQRGEQVVMTGRRPFFYWCVLPAGTRQWAALGGGEAASRRAGLRDHRDPDCCPRPLSCRPLLGQV